MDRRRRLIEKSDASTFVIEVEHEDGESVRTRWKRSSSAEHGIINEIAVINDSVCFLIDEVLRVGSR